MDSLLLARYTFLTWLWRGVYDQGRLSLSTDGDKCAMVNFFLGGGEWKINFGGMKKFIIKSVDFVRKFNNNNLQFTVSEIWL